MRLSGIDISHHNKITNFNDYDFVIIKATEGVTYTDKNLEKNCQLAKNQNKLIGFYHFLSEKTEPEEQAKHFVEEVEKLDMIGKAILVLDFEDKALKKGSPFAKRFLDEVYNLTKVRAIIYMSASTVASMNWKKVAPYHGLWVASYGLNNGKFHTLNKTLRPWPTYAIYQFTSVPLDKDVANMTKQAWLKYANGDR